MKTSVVVKMIDRFERACVPADGPEGARRIPGYVAPHRAMGLRSNGETSWDEPESVSTSGAIHYPRAGRVPGVRLIDAATVAYLDALDAERERLKREIAELNAGERRALQGAYAAAEADLSLADVKAWAQERRAMLAAAKQPA